MQGRHIVKQDSDLMHQRNMKMIYKLIKSERVTTKAKLTRITKLSPTSIGRIVGELIENQFVQEVGQESNGVGRKATSLSLNPNRVLAIGVSVDRGLIQAGIVNVEGELCASIERPIDHSISQEMLIRKTVELIEDLIGRETETGTCRNRNKCARACSMAGRYYAVFSSVSLGKL